MESHRGRGHTRQQTSRHTYLSQKSPLHFPVRFTGAAPDDGARAACATLFPEMLYARSRIGCEGTRHAMCSNAKQ